MGLVQGLQEVVREEHVPDAVRPHPQDGLAVFHQLAIGRADGHHLPGHAGEITSLSWSPDGTYLLSASRDGSARLFAVKTGEHLRTFEGPRRPISGAAPVAIFTATQATRPSA